MMYEMSSCDFCPDGCCDLDCYRCYSPLRPENLRTLAENLAVAAALCRAFELGADVDAHYKHDWWPGCGRSAA